MVQLNLLPDLKKEFLNAQKARNRVISLSILTIILAVGIAGLAAFYVYGVQTVQVALVNGDIAKKTKDLKATPEIDKYLTLQNQLAALPDLHSAKNVYSRLFGFLPTLNPSAPNSISLSSLQVSETAKSALFTGTAPTYEALGVFKDTLMHAKVTYQVAGETNKTSENLFQNVTVQSSGLGTTPTGKVVSFTINVDYDDAAFRTMNTNVEISVPAVQSSQAANQTPTAIFEGGN